MELSDLVNRSKSPLPWAEGDNIPWDDPAFSWRMLKEHLCQDHDHASRRLDKIEKQVGWIHHKLLSGHPTRILDLCCGPGLYTSRLSELGHECIGIDYSPASIAYARERVIKDKLRCTYLLQDVRDSEYGADYGLVMLTFGELNSFSPSDARRILAKAHRALADNGILLLEPQTLAAIRGTGERRVSSWYSEKEGLFSAKPHLCLTEKFWDPASRTSTTRYYVMDASTARVSLHAQSAQAYADEEYRALLIESGFKDAQFFPSLIGVEDESQEGLMAIVARKLMT